MADKIFYVTRTENEQTHTAGTASLHRADKPQLVKVYDNPTDIDVSTLSEGEVVGTKGADFNCVAIVDRVAADNMNPVTSNAVADALSYSTTETPTGGYWIDGKPIYRRVYTGLSFGNTSEAWTNVGITVSNIGTTVKVQVLRTTSTASDFINDLNIRVLLTGDVQYYTKNLLAPVANTLVIEYTKTTD